MYEEYLMHYGRLGMRWGQHIFGKDRSSGTRRAKRQARKQKRANAMAVRRKLEADIRRQKILSNPKLLYKHRNEFSEKELKDAINRLNFESQLRQLSSSQVSKGERFINGFIKTTNTATKVITTTKGLNKATGGVLFGFVNDQLKNNEYYRKVKTEVDKILKEVEIKDINAAAAKEAAKEVAKERLKNQK